MLKFNIDYCKNLLTWQPFLFSDYTKEFVQLSFQSDQLRHLTFEYSTLFVGSSPWRDYVELEGEESDEDFQQVHSRAYLTSSTESEPHDPDHCLLMDEL